MKIWLGSGARGPVVPAVIGYLGSIRCLFGTSIKRGGQDEESGGCRGERKVQIPVGG